MREFENELILFFFCTWTQHSLCFNVDTVCFPKLQIYDICLLHTYPLNTLTIRCISRSYYMYKSDYGVYRFLLVGKVVHSKIIIITAKTATDELLLHLRGQGSRLIKSNQAFYEFRSAFLDDSQRQGLTFSCLTRPTQLPFFNGQFDSSAACLTSSQEESTSYAISCKWTFLVSNVFAVFPPNFPKIAKDGELMIC